jgi:Conjugative transposon protein TcpC
VARGQGRATATVSGRPLWRIRLAREMPRHLLCAAAVAGLAASVRFAVAPPQAVRAAAVVRQADAPDRAAEAYAALFARRYLTWNAAEPQAEGRALEPFLGSGMEPNAGLELPSTGEQRVEWVEIVQSREAAPGEQVYTLAAQTDAMGLVYLTVAVSRASNGSLALTGYPAFVGAPAAGPAEIPNHLREVTERTLATVVQRVLRNYLAAAASELEADLAGGAQVSLPSRPLSLESLERLDWAPEGQAVLATVRAQDERGVQYTLSYELNVVREQGRWEVSAVQTDPDA